MGRPFSLAVDCHSGFWLRDRVWFPLAHTADPIPHLAEVIALEELFEQTHPSHRYLFEPQSLQYRTHGDIWDYLYLEALQQPQHCFLPLTLEMGSWLWVKKIRASYFQGWACLIRWRNTGCTVYYGVILRG
jgi:hypothetical protein